MLAMKENLIWMQSQFRRGLNMLAISNPQSTIYACNRFQIGPDTPAIIENFYMVTWLRDHFRQCKHIFSLFSLIASILGPNCYSHCNYIWSLLWQLLQPFYSPALYWFYMHSKTDAINELIWYYISCCKFWIKITKNEQKWFYENIFIGVFLVKNYHFWAKFKIFDQVTFTADR